MIKSDTLFTTALLSAFAVGAIVFQATPLNAFPLAVVVVSGVILLISRGLKSNLSLPAGLAIILVLAYGLISVSINPINSAFKYITIYIFYAMLFFFGGSFIKGRAGFAGESSVALRSLLFLSYFQLTSYLIGISSLESYDFIVNTDPMNRRGVGFFSIIMFSLLVFYWAELRDKLFSKYLLVPFFVVPFLVLSNGSRTELLFLIFTILLPLLCISRRRVQIFSVIACSIAVTTYFFMSDAYLPIASRFVNMSTKELLDVLEYANETQFVAMTNFRLYESALMLQKVRLFDGPQVLFGCGLGCTVEYPYLLTLDDAVYERTSDFHNGALLLVLQLGVVGLLVLACIVAYWIRIVGSFISGSSRPTATSMALFLTHSFLLLSLPTSAGYFNLSYLIYVAPFFVASVIGSSSNLSANYRGL